MEIKEKGDLYPAKRLEAFRESQRMEGVDRIWLPGEIEHCRILERRERGIPLAPVVVANLRQLAAELNLSDRLE